jgi:Uma2 family endonuclease
VRDADDPQWPNTYWLGADLVIEIVSTNDRERDSIVKPTDDTEVGSPAYWIVNQALSSP